MDVKRKVRRGGQELEGRECGRGKGKGDKEEEKLGRKGLEMKVKKKC